eukprot:TRINITY_DN2208_c0_g1_i1.p1 TRINITY_DN2208_c0_g1~~TRINITY_DN2208_c0_g1_i1.p1  ORF type:complete len:166 (-),score=22.39 TRINITY_DN2208_c0_g1_i1:208-705(-)
MCATTSDDASTERDFCTTAVFAYLAEEKNREDLEHCTDDDGLIENCTDEPECERVMQEMQVFIGRNCVEWLGTYVFASMEMFGDLFTAFYDEFSNELPEEVEMEEFMSPIFDQRDMVMQSAEMIVDCPTIFKPSAVARSCPRDDHRLGRNGLHLLKLENENCNIV